ncbi:MAG: alpha/beta hydrolase [Acidimicrobiales bacterium]|nr:alpha/beta hydrolase [Acidimicrobiales bacterium]
MRATRTRRLAATVLAAAALISACSDDTDVERSDEVTTTSAAETPTGETTTPEAEAPEIAWQSCGGAECATVAVPRDHDEPDGATIDLFVRRLPATGDRIGALFLNFGGPGAGAADLVSRWPVPAEIRERFDIVGMDPRGVGSSTPLDCGLDPATLYSVDPTIEDQGDEQALLDVSERYVEDCASSRPELLPHLGTRDVARDMDLVRAGMGDEQLSFLGYSYGTSIGQVYAELFPDRVRTMVLDGLVDTAPSGIETAVAQAEGFERALQNWADGCPQRASCPFDDPIATVEQVIAAAENGISSSGGTRTLGPGETAIALAYPLYQQSLWTSLDAALAAAGRGDGSGMISLADSYIGIADFSIYFAVSCLDSAWPRDTDVFLAAADAADEDAPRFGEAIVNDYIRCALWPTEPDPIGALRAPGAPPILVVSGTGDPATPYESGVTVADRLDSGVLLTYEGEGHTIVFQDNACIDDLVAAYLVDGSVPSDGATC